MLDNKKWISIHQMDIARAMFEYLLDSLAPVKRSVEDALTVFMED